MRTVVRVALSPASHFVVGSCRFPLSALPDLGAIRTASVDVRKTMCPAPRERNLTCGSLCPLYFEANRGQSDPQVKFLSRGAGHMVFLTSTEAVLIAPRSGRADRGERRSEER